MFEALLDRFEQLVGTVLFGLPPSVQRWLAGKPKIVDGQTLSTELQLMLAAQRLRPGGASLGGGTVKQARARLRRDVLSFVGPKVHVKDVRELHVPGPQMPLKARHYVPESDGSPQPLLVFFHGGGFCIGDLDTHDVPCRMLCRDARVHVLSVDYRLAPEHPFPAAVEDAAWVLRWALDNAASLGADPSRVAVGGDSAGGNLAAVATLLTVNATGRGPCLQLLIYPGTCRTIVRPSWDLFAEGYTLGRADMMWFDRHYMGDREYLRGDVRVSPELAPSHAGLGAALVVTAGFDPLRDEGEAYAQLLAAAGNRVTSWREPSLVHGFINMVGVSASARRAVERIGFGMRKMLDEVATGAPQPSEVKVAALAGASS